jgi:hypothetical protein
MRDITIGELRPLEVSPLAFEGVFGHLPLKSLTLLDAIFSDVPSRASLGGDYKGNDGDLLTFEFNPRSGKFVVPRNAFTSEQTWQRFRAETPQRAILRFPEIRFLMNSGRVSGALDCFQGEVYETLVKAEYLPTSVDAELAPNARGPRATLKYRASSSQAGTLTLSIEEDLRDTPFSGQITSGYSGLPDLIRQKVLQGST